MEGKLTVTFPEPQGRTAQDARPAKVFSAALCLPANPVPVEESAAAEEQDHDEDDEERVGVHLINAGRPRPMPSVQL